MGDTFTHIGDILARNARMYPDDVALIERIPAEKKRSEMTWKQFDDRANQFANVLLKKGIKKGDKVVHFMMNSIDWLVAYFGIVRTGAWVVPLNFRFTAADVKYCCDVAEPKIIVFDEEFTDRITAITGQLPTVEEYICVGNKTPDYAQPYAKLFAGASVAALSVAIGPQDECGLYFTSGTTGQPKPILLTHDNMLWACITENVHHRQTKQDCFILIPPLYHTGAKMHWFGSFIVAGKAVILKGISPEWTLEAVSEEGGTIVWLLVPWAQDILMKFESGELKPSDYKLGQWRLMHIGAQPVPPSLIRQWKERFPAMDYDTNYGLSESTGPGCVHLGMGNEHKIGAIGIPGFNWEFKIVDENGQTLKQGDLGELCVRGPGIMREYYKNPEATAKALRDGWLYTGDMAKQDEDGYFYIVDRKKELIKPGGYQVWPREVEEALSANPKVLEVGVAGIPDPYRGETVKAWIVLKPGETLTDDEVKAWCKDRLAAYKVPTHIEYRKELPKTTVGKILRRELVRQHKEAES